MANNHEYLQSILSALSVLQGVTEEDLDDHTDDLKEVDETLTFISEHYL